MKNNTLTEKARVGLDVKFQSDDREFVGLIDVCIAKSEDYSRAQYDKLLIDRNFKKKA